MKRFAATTVALLLAAATTASAAKPARNVSAARHPNIAAAQKHCQEAYTRITEAQKANEWDMEGHAQKAKELLEQVNNELKLAAEAANKNAK
jgi:hypothetical protein